MAYPGRTSSNIKRSLSITNNMDVLRSKLLREIIEQRESAHKVGLMDRNKVHSTRRERERESSAEMYLSLYFFRRFSKASAREGNGQQQQQHPEANT